jgi:hypothetical protein
MITVEQPTQTAAQSFHAVGLLALVWGIGGVAAVILYASVSLSAQAISAINSGLSPFAWAAMIANVVFMAWAEGYRGFQQRFSPRVAARALHLAREPVWWCVALAPLFCAGYFGATKRLQRTIWIGTGLIVLAVIAFSWMPQPWRGVLDAGVVVGLGWGVVSLLHAGWIVVRDRRGTVPDEVPAAR